MEVEEDVVAELDAVDVGMRLQAPACGKEEALSEKDLERHRSSLLLFQFCVKHVKNKNKESPMSFMKLIPT